MMGLKSGGTQHKTQTRAYRKNPDFPLGLSAHERERKGHSRERGSRRECERGT